jgi:hypothetical protein
VTENPKLTGHMETGFAFLDVLPAVGTRLGVVGNPFLRLSVLRITVIPGALKLLRGEALVPRNHVLVAHLKGTLLALNVRLHLLGEAAESWPRPVEWMVGGYVCDLARDRCRWIGGRISRQLITVSVMGLSYLKILHRGNEWGAERKLYSI